MEKSNEKEQQFIWAAATASYQIEGSWDADGKGLSIWDDFCHEGGRVKNGDTGDVACDSYRRYKEDVQLLRQLSVSHYRFSVSWPRVLPQGAGEVNEAGIGYYSDLVDELLSNGIQPIVTMYHWDLPLQLQRSYGGWQSDRVVKDFEAYADVLFGRLGDRVKLWLTLNEPYISSVLGHGSGEHAPGIKEPLTAPYQTGHRLLLAHAAAYRLYDRKYRHSQGGRVGIALNAEWMLPRNADSESDVAAAERAMQFSLGWFADPIFLGDYPEQMRRLVGEKSEKEGLPESRLPVLTQQQQQQLHHSADFLGLNLYTSQLAAHRAGAGDSDCEFSRDPRWGGSGSRWLSVTPEGLGSALNWIRRRYGNPPTVVTENGVSDNSGDVADDWRVRFLEEYTRSALDAKEKDGCNLIGYCVWSLLDNFEWAEGYSEKFGIVAVDFASPERRRRPKRSAEWLAEFVRRQRRAGN